MPRARARTASSTPTSPCAADSCARWSTSRCRRRSTCGPDLASIAVGVNDTLRRRFDLDPLATALENGVRDLRGSRLRRPALRLRRPGPPVAGDGAGARADPRPTTPRSTPSPSTTTATSSASGRWPPIDDDRLWDEDRLHLSPAGHRLAARTRPRGAGARRSAVADARWCPRRDPHAGRRRRRICAGRRGHLAPWVVRRMRGESSGDEVRPKHPGWVRLPGPACSPSKTRNRLQVSSRQRRMTCHAAPPDRTARRAPGPPAADARGLRPPRGAGRRHPRAAAAGHAPPAGRDASGTSGSSPTSSGCWRRPTASTPSSRRPT